MSGTEDQMFRYLAVLRLIEPHFDIVIWNLTFLFVIFHHEPYCKLHFYKLFRSSYLNTGDHTLIKLQEIDILGFFFVAV